MSCMVPGCRNEAANGLGIRLRRPSTRAVFSPECEAYLCKDHAEGGGTFRIDFDPDGTGKVTTIVESGGKLAKRRSTPIRNSAA